MLREFHSNEFLPNFLNRLKRRRNIKMFTKHTGIVAICLALFALPNIALAYIGPGAGITFIGALIGLVLAFLSALGFILFWPVRRVWRRMKAKKEDTETVERQDAPPIDAPPIEEDPAREGAPVDN